MLRYLSWIFKNFPSKLGVSSALVCWSYFQLNQAGLALPFCWALVVSQLLWLKSRKIDHKFFGQYSSWVFQYAKILRTLNTIFLFFFKNKWSFWNVLCFAHVRSCCLSCSCYWLSTCLGIKAAFFSESGFRDEPMNFLPPASSGCFPDGCGEEPRLVIASFQAQFGLFFETCC